MKIKKINLISSSVLYAVFFLWVYRNYLHPLFGYAGYLMFPKSVVQDIIAIIFAVVPVFLYRSNLLASGIIGSLIYCLYYIPVIVTLHYGLNKNYLDVIFVQLAFVLSMSVVFFVDSTAKSIEVEGDGRIPRKSIYVLTLGLMLIVAYVYRNQMRLVSFSDVYDLRESAGVLSKSAVIGYSLTLLTYCFLPFVISMGIVFKSKVGIFLGVSGCFLIYLSTGSKASLLTPLILFFIFKIINLKGYFLTNLLYLCSFLSAILVIFFPDSGSFMWVKSLFFMRTLGVTGLGVSAYYDYFSDNGYTFYSHIRLVNLFTDMYPYGELTLGQVVGRVYSSNLNNNFNVGFWATDGVAAAGVFGVLFITSIFIVYLRVLNYATSFYNQKFVGVWVSGYCIALLNLPFSTAMVSGGGLIIILICLWSRTIISKHNRPHKF